MEGIETLAVFEEKVSITPRDLANAKLNIHAVLLAKLAEKIEGKCSLHGWVMPNSTKILSRSMGYLESGRFTGDLVFHIQAQAAVLNPPSGSHLVCQVVGNNMMGMYVSYKVRMRELNKKTKQMVATDVDAIKCILPRDLHIGDEAFSKVEIGDSVHVEIKKSRFQVNDKFILSVGIFEGKTESDYVPREVEERENVPVVEEGPSKAADVAAREFDELERLRQRQREEQEAEETRRREREAEVALNEMPPLERDPAIQGATTGNEEPPAKGYRTSPGLGQDRLPYETGEPIYFNAGKIKEYQELDNRYPAKFTLDGVNWPSVEHYYQAMKFPEFPELQEQIRMLPKVSEALKLGKTKDPSKPIRADWKEKREGIVRKAVFAKFEQNPALKKLLLDTYPRPLIFADANDSFWGYGRTKQGQNKLGQTLMEYRSTHTGMEALN
jgi:ribA/ribD-fused uncharacterized protein